MVAIPFRGSLNAGFGRSMITERLLKGIDIEVLSDLGSNFPAIFRNLFSGVLFLILTGMILNAFLGGGLFNSLKSPSLKFSASEFFRNSAEYFWSFLGITLIISAILIVLGILIIGIPMSISGQVKSAPEGAIFLTGILSGSFFIVCSIVFLLVADYARAWQVKNGKPACFRALGFGFSITFSTFKSSFPLMLILLLFHILFLLLVMLLVGKWKPVTGGGVFLLFLLTQLLFIIRLYLKMWRYGSVTTLMEISDKSPAEQMIVNPGNTNNPIIVL